MWPTVGFGDAEIGEQERSVGDAPADDSAAEDIDDDVEILIRP